MSMKNSYPDLPKLTDATFFKNLMQKYGGEANLRAKYPLVCDGFEQTKTAQADAAKTDSLGIPATGENRLENYIYFAYARYDAAAKKFFVKPVFSLKKAIHATYEITVKAGATVYGQQNGSFTSNGFCAEEIAVANALQTVVAKEFTVLIRGDFTYDGLPYPYERTAAFRTDEVYAKAATILNPRKNGAPGDKVKIYYGRLPSTGEAVDHNYPNALDTAGLVEIYLPVCGSIPLTAGTPNVDGPTASASALLDFGQGVVVCPQAKIDVPQNPQNFSWLFETDWGVKIRRSYFGPNFTGYVSLYFSFPVSGLTEPCQLYASSLASGTLPNAVSPLKMMMLAIGCVEKGSLVRMADGSEHPIEQVCIGDRVMLPGGGMGTVMDTVRGQEEELVYVTTKNGHALGLTDTHRILTRDGMAEARDLTADMEIGMEDGSFSPIEFLYMKEYRDTVYNLHIDCGSAPKRMLCNGMIISEMENAPDVKPKRAVLADAGADELFAQLLACAKEFGY